MPAPLRPIIPGDWQGLEQTIKDLWAILNEEESFASLLAAIQQNASDIAAIDDVAGNDKEVQFNDGGDFGASANFTFDKVTNIADVNGTIQVTRLLAGGVEA